MYRKEMLSAEEIIEETITPTQPVAPLSAAEIRLEYAKFAATVKAYKECTDALGIASAKISCTVTAYDSAVRGEGAAAVRYEKAKKASNAEGDPTPLRTRINENIARREHENAVDKLSLAEADLKTAHDAFAVSKGMIASAFKNKLSEIAGKRKQPESTTSAPAVVPTAAGAEKRVRFGATQQL